MGLGSRQMTRYFSAKPPALVTRFGTGTYLGAVLKIVSGVVSIEWDEDSIVAISDAELITYSREYAGLVRDGSLAEHNRATYQAFLTRSAEAAEQAAKQLGSAIVAADQEFTADAEQAPAPDGVNDAQ